MEIGIGLAIWNFKEGTLAERIQRCADAGFDYVSLIGEDAANLSRGRCPEAEDAILRNSLRVTVHGSMMSRSDLVDPGLLLQDFDALIAWHARTSRLIGVHYDPARSSDSEYLSSHMRDVLREMLRISSGTGVVVGVEDWPVTLSQLQGLEELTKFDHFGLLIDLGHLNIRLRRTCGLDVPFPIEAMRDFFNNLPVPVNELHIHNNNGERDQHAPPPNGTADLAAVGETLARAGIKCVSTIEIVPSWCGLDDQQGWQAAKEAADFWRRVYTSLIS